jgi:hypothetical protein
MSIKKPRTTYFNYNINSTPLSDYLSSPSIKSYESIEKKYYTIDKKRISNDMQEYYAKLLLDTYIKRNNDLINFVIKEINENKKIDIQDISSKILNKKNILAFPSIIYILSKLEELEIPLYKKFPLEEMRSFHEDTNSYILYFNDVLGLKVLYLMVSPLKKLYLSPLNDKKYRNIIRKRDFHLINDIMIKKTLKRLSDKKNIDGNDYDLILFHNNILENFYTNDINLKNYKYDSSLLKCEGHVISITNINNNKVVNLAFNYNNNQFHINEFDYLKDEYYRIEQNSNDDYCLNKIYKDEFETTDFKSFNSYNKDDFFDPLHFFVSNKIKKIYKTIDGGDVCSSYKIKNNKKYYFPNNNKSICWFISIMNIYCNSDNISLIVNNKICRLMNKVLLDIKKFVDEEYVKNNYDIDVNKRHANNVIILSIFVYSSYFILSKNLLNNVKNISKWRNILYKLLDKTMLCYISFYMSYFGFW